MNTFDQILIRMGVDARGVVVGLNSVTSQVKSWGMTLAEEIKGKVGGFFAAGAVIEGFSKVREEVQEISRLSEELGVSTNFIQSLQLKSQQMGMSLESISRPFVFFNRQIGEAKRGIPSVIESLHDMGVISNQNQISTLTYAQAMSNLKVQFDKIGDAAKQDALLNEAFGRSSYQMAFIFRQTQAEFDKMNEGNFFTKFSPAAVTTIQRNWSGVKAVIYGIGATFSNVYGYAEKGTDIFANWLKQPLLQNPLKGFQAAKAVTDEQFKQIDNQNQMAQKAQDDIQVEQEKADLLSKQSDLLERQLELTSEISDRGKSSVEDMAEDYRRKLGLPKPRLYGVTPREATAYEIKNLEDRSSIAFEQGNDALYKSLQSEALRIRQANPWLKLSDRDPFMRTNIELQAINQQLGPVKEAANLILTEHKNGG
jgi:hypothetical protein